MDDLSSTLLDIARAGQSMSQSDAVATIALTLPVNPTTRDVLRALALAYRAGWHGGLAHAQTLAKKMLQQEHTP